MTFIFRNRTIFWDISKWNIGQTKWDGGSIYNLYKSIIYKSINNIKLTGFGLLTNLCLIIIYLLIIIFNYNYRLNRNFY